jgi:hypothetical protein
VKSALIMLLLASDVKNSSITVNQFKLYSVVLAKQFIKGILQITTPRPGVEIYPSPLVKNQWHLYVIQAVCFKQSTNTDSAAT